MSDPGLVAIKRALISVSDKTGLDQIGPWLDSYGIEIIATGSTAQYLRDKKVRVKEVGEVTGFPEILDGRVKTLHPLVHGGILADRSKKTHQQSLQQHHIKLFDLVIVNLYPFAEAVKKGGDYQECVENIDVGGPAMIRAAAKNHKHVTVITDPRDYGELRQHMGMEGGNLPLAFRQAMAAKAFALTASYDAAINGWLSGQMGEDFPQSLILRAERAQILRYGENPQQQAAFYRNNADPSGLYAFRQMQGKELSYNNILDSDAAIELAAEFNRPSVAIIKHANPCGVASADDIAGAYRAALKCDPTSAFGGIVACNRALDKESAEAITQIFTEVVIAPDASEDAITIFKAKPNLRLLLTGAMPDPKRAALYIRSVSGGYLLQGRDNAATSLPQLRVVSKRAPSDKEMQDMLFAWTVAKHVKSNAIVYAANNATLGIGAGQMSRIDSTRIAKIKAEEHKLDLNGAAAASDAFFPFADGVEVIAQAGIKSIIQPGGSVRDKEVIEAADKHGLAMVLTGTRHFRH